jgi:hypothetical protein
VILDSPKFTQFTFTSTWCLVIIRSCFTKGRLTNCFAPEAVLKIKPSDVS